MSQPSLRHIAIIMDGNGRWATKRGLERLKGHQEGVEAIQEICTTCITNKVPYLTLFGFSTENWNRPEYEVNGIMAILQNTLERKIKELVENGIRLRTIGDLSRLPKALQKEIQKAITATAQGEKLTLTLALNYGARAEAVDAVRAYVNALKNGKENLEELTWETFSNYLQTRELPDPDMIIRPSGECRISNFLLLQGAYAELYFTPTYWPDFGEEDLNQAITWYYGRNRRYGNIPPSA